MAAGLSWVVLAVLSVLVIPNLTDAQAPAPTPTSVVTPADERWIWCVEDEADKDICDQMVDILRSLDPETAHTHSCVVGDGDEDCMRRIKSREATFGLFDGGEILEAYEEFQLKPVRIENSGSGLNNMYYGIGVVKKGQCPNTLLDLEGRRSCHTGYGRTSGWVLPMTYLLDNNIMPLVTTGPQSNDIESVKQFFSKSCAASHHEDEAICTACKVTTGCTEADDYYDYEGAFRGVVEGACDIGFTKHVIPEQYALNGVNQQSDWVGLQDAAEYQIVCPTLYEGESCTEVTNYAQCNFGAGPSHTVMVSSDWPQEEVEEFNKVMDAANSDADFSALFFEGNNKGGVIFSADTTKTSEYEGTVEALLGSLYNVTLRLASLNDVEEEVNDGGADGGFKINPIAGVLIVLVMAFLGC